MLSQSLFPQIKNISLWHDAGNVSVPYSVPCQSTNVMMLCTISQPDLVFAWSSCTGQGAFPRTELNTLPTTELSVISINTLRPNQHRAKAVSGNRSKLLTYRYLYIYPSVNFMWIICTAWQKWHEKCRCDFSQNNFSTNKLFSQLHVVKCTENNLVETTKLYLEAPVYKDNPLCYVVTVENLHCLSHYYSNIHQ